MGCGEARGSATTPMHVMIHMPDNTGTPIQQDGAPLTTCPELDSQQLHHHQEANQIKHHTCCHSPSNSQESSMVEWRSRRPPHGSSCPHANSATGRLDPTTTHAKVADERDRKEMNEDPGSGGRGEMAPPPPSSLPAKHLAAEAKRSRG